MPDATAAFKQQLKQAFDTLQVGQTFTSESAWKPTPFKGVEGKAFLVWGWGNGEPVVLAPPFIRNFSLTKR